MARYISAFAFTELLTSAAFSYLIGDKGPATHAILHHIRNISDRITVLADVAALTGNNAVADVIKPLKDANKRRVILAHGLWTEADDGSVSILTNITDKSRRRSAIPIDEATLKGWVDDINQLNASLRAIGFPMSGVEHGLIYGS